MTTANHETKAASASGEDYEAIGQLVIDALHAIRALIERLRPEVLEAPDRSPTFAEMAALYALCAEIPLLDGDVQEDRSLRNSDAAPQKTKAGEPVAA